MGVTANQYTKTFYIFVKIEKFKADLGIPYILSVQFVFTSCLFKTF